MSILPYTALRSFLTSGGPAIIVPIEGSCEKGESHKNRGYLAKASGNNFCTAAVATAADLHVCDLLLTVIKHAIEVNHYPAINVLNTEGLEGPGAHLGHCIRT